MELIGESGKRVFVDPNNEIANEKS